MNEDKAREFFSAYYEGVLEPGLRQSFERKLGADAQLQAEYGLFERTMRELSDLKLEEIEIPYNLHEIISARIDRRIFEQGRKTPSGIAAYWRNLAFGGVALAAIVGAIYGLPKGSNGHGPTANPFPIEGAQPPVAAAPKIEFRATEKSVSVEVNASTETVLTIDTKDKGTLMRNAVHAGVQSITPLENPQPEAAMLGVGLVGDTHKYLIALPGKVKSESIDGEGDLSAFAVAVAGFYGEPVVVDVRDPNITVHWSLTAKDGAHAVATALADTHLNFEQRQGPLTITDRQ